MINVLNGKNVAVCIMQPSLRLVLPDGQIWEAKSTPLPLRTTSYPAETVLGFTGMQSPRSTGETERELTTEEMASDAIFVPAIPEFVDLLRGAGFRGQILTPGPIKPASDGKPAAHHNTVTIMIDPPTIMILAPGQPGEMMEVGNPMFSLK